MGDEHADQANHFLHGAVRVIEKSSFLMNREFVGKSFAWCDGFLADVGHAILLDGNFQTMPVHGSALRQAIFHMDAHAVALLHL